MKLFGVNIYAGDEDRRLRSEEVVMLTYRYAQLSMPATERKPLPLLVRLTMRNETRTAYHTRRSYEEHAEAVLFAGWITAPLHRRSARMHRELARETSAQLL